MLSSLLVSSLYWIIHDPRLIDAFDSAWGQLEEFGSDRLKLVSFGSLVKQPEPLVEVDESWGPFGPMCARDSTLGLFDDIFVVSLPWRMDRREDMERIRRDLGLNWTLVDATTSTQPAVLDILDNVRLLREGLAQSQEEPYFEWPDEWPEDFPIGSDFWTYDSETSALPPPESSDLSLSRIRSETTATSSEEEKSQPAPLTCATRNSTTGISFVPSLPTYMHLTPAKVACWHSHVRVIQDISTRLLAGLPNNSSCKGATLILEDDVDMEKDIGERLHALWPGLPSQWDIVFLGQFLIYACAITKFICIL